MGHRIILDRYRSRARALRRNMTEAERCIWTRIRAHRLNGAAFRRQFPIGPYVVDFVCLEARLIIEIDGGQHASTTVKHDQKRDAWLLAQGFRILRFWNHDVLANRLGVLECLAQTLRECLPPFLTLPRKGGRDMPNVGEAQE